MPRPSRTPACKHAVNERGRAFACKEAHVEARQRRSISCAHPGERCLLGGGLGVSLFRESFVKAPGSRRCRGRARRPWQNERYMAPISRHFCKGAGGETSIRYSNEFLGGDCRREHHPRDAPSSFGIGPNAKVVNVALEHRFRVPSPLMIPRHTSIVGHPRPDRTTLWHFSFRASTPTWETNFQQTFPSATTPRGRVRGTADSHSQRQRLADMLDELRLVRRVHPSSPKHWSKLPFRTDGYFNFLGRETWKPKRMVRAKISHSISSIASDRRAISRIFFPHFLRKGDDGDWARCGRGGP
jgi:hypothetical protein